MMNEKRKISIVLAIAKRVKMSLKVSKVKSMTFESNDKMYEYLKDCKLQNKIIDCMSLNCVAFDDIVDLLVVTHLCKNAEKARLRILRHVAKDSETITIARRNMLELSA